MHGMLETDGVTGGGIAALNSVHCAGHVGCREGND